MNNECQLSQSEAYEFECPNVELPMPEAMGVRGRLREHVKFWQDIGAPTVVRLNLVRPLVAKGAEGRIFMCCWVHGEPGRAEHPVACVGCMRSRGLTAQLHVLAA